MPKFRDLGINAIPITMRPPEVGHGGGREGATTDCDENRTCVGGEETTECAEELGPTCSKEEEEETTECGGRRAATCKEEETTECADQGGTCRKDEPDIPTECGAGFTCGADKDTPGKGFSAEAVAELRQQLESRIDQSLEI